ncbi:hypothetical protein TVAG_052390 [Trichomonas vaginalis G3]|uniref:receptor protein-tyrosine kinase n=1 Tax=Trichomonas vaginalis (strain ATCC PRA-98 / G3) TaxID=412133 RepID=A2FGG7_TRIV3|nr:glycine-rich protein family [Trichomonas vaginalis G3]EAX95981.1 hypothetical protein TVAG_052390 [Trichomonas vaginalis G3]KAI5537691.1 glycine-rich protein family [Trichomonas vaginalis G3]|eukprot:XP_001308911.1 hypothetical protein [Trichomonas vaginalis G3]
MGDITAKYPTYGGGGPGQLGGGGSSDIRLKPGDFGELEGLKSRIIVAAGAGSPDSLAYDSSRDDYGGSAGGLVGYSSDSGNNVPGNQTSGGYGIGPYKGRFGFGGGNGERRFYDGSPDGNGSGGGGYFGGSASSVEKNYGGAGGSSFISGHKGCIAISEDFTEENPKFSEREDPSIHYSNITFFNTVMIDGKHLMPLVNGSMSYGNPGNGSIRITTLFLYDCPSFYINYNFCSFKFNVIYLCLFIL